MRIASVIVGSLIAVAALAQDKPLRVGIAGSEPFVVKETSRRHDRSLRRNLAGAGRARGLEVRVARLRQRPDAIDELASGNLDTVVGPVNITAERAERVRFSQPYFQSSLSILSRTDSPSPWQRIAPFFSTPFYYAGGS